MGDRLRVFQNAARWLGLRSAGGVVKPNTVVLPVFDLARGLEGFDQFAWNAVTAAPGVAGQFNIHLFDVPSGVVVPEFRIQNFGVLLNDTDAFVSTVPSGLNIFAIAGPTAVTINGRLNNHNPLGADGQRVAISTGIHNGQPAFVSAGFRLRNLNALGPGPFPELVIRRLVGPLRLTVFGADNASLAMGYVWSESPGLV